MPAYDTVTEALNELKKRGFLIDFNLAFDKIKCNETGLCLSPAEFEVTESYRFEGNTNPADEEVVYAIESKDGSIKGTLVTGYGAYSESSSDVMLEKLSVKKSS